MFKQSLAAFESRLRLVLLGIMLAALLLQGATALVFRSSRQALVAELLSPLRETLDRMEVNAATSELAWQTVHTERRGREERTRFYLRDTVNATVYSAWLRLPPVARAKVLKGKSAEVKRQSHDGVYWHVYRVIEPGPDAQLISAGRRYPDFARMAALETWHTTGQIVALSLMLVAVLLIARELARPFQQLQRVARVAQQNLQVSKVPKREEWDGIIETFKATIQRLEANELRLQERFQDAEEARLQLEDFSTQMIDAIPSALIATDHENRIVRFNPAAAELPGLTAPQAGQLLTDWLAGHEPWKEIVACEEHAEGELEGRHEGEPFSFGFHRLVLQDGGFLLLLHDRTKLRRLETLLAQRARLAALGETAAGLAHELRNAMAAIVGYARLADRAGDREAADITGRIESEARATEEMLNRFLEVARPTEPRRVDVVAEEIVTETLDQYEGRFLDRQIAMQRNLGDAATIKIDPFWLRQALVNLLENALVCVPARGTVRVESECTEDYWRLTVADNGPGIEPQWRDRVLAPFVSMRAGGTGLGLALVQKVTTAHDGQVEVSESAEGGARFDLYFAREQPAATAGQGA